MPASLYRLAGKPHHTEAIVVDATAQQITESDATEEPVERIVDSVAVSDTVNDAETQTQDESPAGDQTVEETASAPAPSWDPSWTKSQLLAVASQLGLSVTMENTKVEIVAALTAATSS